MTPSQDDLRLAEAAIRARHEERAHAVAYVLTLAETGEYPHAVAALLEGVARALRAGVHRREPEQPHWLRTQTAAERAEQAIEDALSVEEMW